MMLGATLLVLGTVAAACDGDDRLTLEEYFERFEAIAGFPVSVTDALDQLEELNPPSEAEDAHDEFLAAGRELVEVFEISEVEQSGEEVEGAQEEAQERFDAACLDLVGVGEANGIAVDVSCDDDDEEAAVTPVAPEDSGEDGTVDGESDEDLDALRAEAEALCPAEFLEPCSESYITFATGSLEAALCITPDGKWFMETPQGAVGDACSDADGVIVAIVGGE